MQKYILDVDIRKKFQKELSRIYSTEVNSYKESLPIIANLNNQNRDDSPNMPLVQEHHGAIRLGIASEMRVIRRLFAVLGMSPVNYYDLSAAGLPVHSTAFRDVSKDGLDKNAFRIFASLLRVDLIKPSLQDKILKIINKRQIVNDRTLQLINLFEKQGGLNNKQADEFVIEASKTFKRQEKANVSYDFYKELLEENSLLADIVSFATPHLNHLTPKIDNIDKLFSKFAELNIKTTPVIQGPPKRKVPILLRQMSFQAVVEDFLFPSEDGGYIKSGHRARFGEYETKGDAALTQKGRDLYDRLLNETLSLTTDQNPDYVAVLESVFKKFPDELDELRKQELVYFNYSVNEDKSYNISDSSKNWEQLINENYINYEPVHYHDFLPISAAGIFKSNLVEGGFVNSEKSINKQSELEEALGCNIIDAFDLYEAEQAKSINNVCKHFNIEV